MAFGEPQIKDTERMAQEMLFLLGIMNKGIKVSNIPVLDDRQNYNTITAVITLENGEHVNCKVNWEPNVLPQTVIRQMMHAVAFTFTVACRSDGQYIWDATIKAKKDELKKRNNGHEHSRHTDASPESAESDPGTDGEQNSI
jgi:hypothetical protein